MLPSSMLMKLALAAIALTAGAEHSHALTCDKTNAAAPSVVTLMASTTSPATEAWVVTPKCQVLVVPIEKRGDEVGLSSDYAESAVERIESLPSDVTDFGTALQPLTKGANLAGSTKLKTFSVVMTSGKTIDISFPKSIERVAFFQGSLTSIDNFKLPDTVTLLRVQSHALTSLKNVDLPSALTQLLVAGNKISAIDFALPPKLEYLDIGSNPITQIKSLTMPDTLVSFNCDKCQLTTFKGVRLSPSLSTLSLGGAITDFEVRQSDLAVLKQLKTFTVSVQQTTCSDSQGTLLAVRGVSTCIITDDRFTELYSNTPSPEAGSSTKMSSSASTDGGSTSASADSESTKSSETDGSSSIATNTTDSSEPQDLSTGGVSTSGSKRSQPSDTAGSSSSAGSNSNTLLLVVVGSVGILFAVLIGLIGYRVFFYKKHQHRQQDRKDLDTPDAFVATTTPAADDTANSGNVVNSSRSSSSDPSTTGSQEYLTNDIRNDKLLLPMRIDRGEVVIGRMVARGGYGVIFRGKYDGRDVAIKQMLPDAWRNETMLMSFMDEIRLCASLDHPKIVQFVGITWSTLRDLSVLTEFMTGGDLQNVLYNQPSEPQPEDWIQQWSPQQLNSKLSMAVDISEAVVYLHSFSAPIIHRDLKSKNVLLDKRGNAKLSDFGISRELSLDETMTSEIGTAAWIAPEVLRGERYSEKADIYSLGVVLVEMDRCRHPYADEPSLRMAGGPRTRYGNTSASSVAHKSTQIAVLVSTGRLHPSMTEKAPVKLRELVARCFSFQPDERPTAMEVGYELRQILREYR